jgi:hypothetical protein
MNNNGLYSLQFTFEFQAGETEIYFAHSIPYTYTMLTEFMNKYATKDKAKRITYCHSLAGNKVECLIITNKQRNMSVLSLKKPPLPRLQDEI